MVSVPPHEQLRCARTRRGESLAALSARTGLRVHHIRAIEEGRFGDLPPGIYGRSAIRSFATAYALDPDAVLADCDALLRQVEDPIDAIARLRGIARTVEAATDAAPCTTHTTTSADLKFRPFAAATVDGVVMGTLLVALSAGAALLARVSIAALGSSGVSLFLVALIFETGYYVWLGGLSGTTFGEYAVGPTPLQRDPRPLTLRAIVLRTLATSTADARAIYVIGIWTGRRLRRGGAARTAPPPAPSPLPPPPRDREEALTWSTRRRASVPPPPLHPRHG